MPRQRGMSVRFVGQPSHTAPKMHREISKEYLK